MLGPGQAQLALVFVEFTKSTNRSRRQCGARPNPATPPSSAEHATQCKHSVNTQGGRGGHGPLHVDLPSSLAHHDRADSPTSLTNILLNSLHFAPISQHSPARRPRGPGCGRGAAVKRRQANKRSPCSVELIWSRETPTGLPCLLAKAHYLLPLSHISPRIF